MVQQVNAKGGHAIQFTRLGGDLSTKEGVQNLWTWVMMYEPNHIWVAPECRLWGRFSRYKGRGHTLFDRVSKEREGDRCRLKLCNDLCMHQVGTNKHFHLEQPQGSELMEQREMMDTKLGTLKATFGMCQVGRLKRPQSESYLQKRTQVSTTSRRLFETLYTQMCPKNHDPHKG